jgi:integrase
MRIENLDWKNGVIFVTESKTAGAYRLIPRSRRVFDVLRMRCAMRQQRWMFMASIRQPLSGPAQADTILLR